MYGLSDMIGARPAGLVAALKHRPGDSARPWLFFCRMYGAARDLQYGRLQSLYMAWWTTRKLFELSSWNIQIGDNLYKGCRVVSVKEV